MGYNFQCKGYCKLDDNHVGPCGPKPTDEEELVVLMKIIRDSHLDGPGVEDKVRQELKRRYEATGLTAHERRERMVNGWS